MYKPLEYEKLQSEEVVTVLVSYTLALMMVVLYLVIGLQSQDWRNKGFQLTKNKRPQFWQQGMSVAALVFE